ncbi:MAG: protein ImuB [Myxococcales bacterium]|nr:protein ImuB [Myxococcales bacterium]
MRLACVFVPQLALQSVLRRTPEARGGTVALLAADGDKKPRVTEMSEEARRAGVRRGMTAAQAAASAPALRLLAATTADIEAARAALADVAYGFTSRIDDAEPGRVFFDVGDLDRLYPEGDQAIAQAIAARARHVGLGVRVAIAPSKGIARVATRARTVAVIPPGGARAFLAPLPVQNLLGDNDRPDPGDGYEPLRTSLRRWGVANAGALAALPPSEVALRLGAVGGRLCRLAAGIDDEPFVPHLPADALEEAVELDYPIAELEPLSFVLRGLIDRALARLACRSLACAGLTLRLTLDPRGIDVRDVPIAAPTRESGTLLQLARLDLTRRPPDAPVVGIRLIALPARARAGQLDFLRPSGPAPDRLAATIARLAALIGPDNVGAPQIQDSWREEAVTVAPFPVGASALGSAAGSVAPGGRPGLTIRRFRPAQPIEVLIDRDGPAALRGQETTARILIAAGPYRVSGEWWRPDSEGGDFSQDYWDVHASDGALYRLHQDRRDGRWYLDGYYD